ncbi:hypothetical protein Ancab_026855 [Ancistrocladus abbreviatus]
MTSPPADWFQFYQTDLIGQGSSTTALVSTQLSDATVVSTTISSPTTLTNQHYTSGASSSPSSPHLNPDGRVSKPIRRRSRASRRTPTTLLNTDTTNFRAMVQQFTGGPTSPFPSSPGPGIRGSNFNTGGCPGNLFQNPGSGYGYLIDFQQMQSQQHQFPRQQNHHMFPENYTNAPEHGGLVDDHQIGVSSTSPSIENNKNKYTSSSFLFQ